MNTTTTALNNVWKKSAPIIASILFAFASPKNIAAEKKNPPLPPIAPYWVFKPWVWEDNKNTQKSTLELVNGYINRKIPVGTVIIDSPWETSYHSFEWDEKRYPNPKKLIATLHAKNVKVVMWITGAINKISSDTPNRKECPFYKFVKEKKYVVNNGADYKWWKGTGVHIDFTNEKAKKWFFEQMDKLHAIGVDGWKVDQGEQTLGKQILSSIGEISLQKFKTYYYSALTNHATATNPRIITLARPISHQGGKAAPIDKCIVGWSGDFRGSWAGMQKQRSLLYQSANAGYGALCVEVGGYTGAKSTKEELIRYAQFGAFMPVMSNGGANGGMTNHLPWFHDDETVDIYRLYATIHAELAPYLFSSCVDKHLGTGPLVKPMGKTSHLLGKDIFVATIMDASNKINNSFPKEGQWIDFWNPTMVHDGGTKNEIKCSLREYPVFIRAGSIIPLAVDNDIAGHGGESSKGKITLWIHPKGKTTRIIHIHENDGTKYSDVSVSCDAAKGNISLEGKKKRAYRFLIEMKTKPKNVSGFDSWSYDSKKKRLVGNKTGDSFSVSIKQ